MTVLGHLDVVPQGVDDDNLNTTEPGVSNGAAGIWPYHVRIRRVHECPHHDHRTIGPSDRQVGRRNPCFAEWHQRAMRQTLSTTRVIFWQLHV